MRAHRELHRLEAQRRREAFEYLVPDSIIRRAIVTHYPGALSGAMGPRPFLWFLADSKGAVIRTATGRNALSRWSYSYLRDSMPSFLVNVSPARKAEIEKDGLEYLDPTAARRQFPELSHLSAADSIITVMKSLPGTPIEVAWIQLSPGSLLP